MEIHSKTLEIRRNSEKGYSLIAKWHMLWTFQALHNEKDGKNELNLDENVNEQTYTQTCIDLSRL